MGCERVAAREFQADLRTRAGFAGLPFFWNFSHASDLILLDLHMPEMSGIAVMEAVGGTCLGEDEYLPILLLTSDVSNDAKQRSLAAGVADFLIKPCSPADILPRVHALLRTRAMFKRLARKHTALRCRV